MPIAVRMLDNVIDLNFYPHAKVKHTNLKTRAIGLGVMGEAQMLAERGVIHRCFRGSVWREPRLGVQHPSCVTSLMLEAACCQTTSSHVSQAPAPR